jgi:hypothetical protein
LEEYLLILLGYWKGDQKHGRGKLIEANEDFYEGEFSQGKFNGQGTYTYLSKEERYKGSWVNNKKEGEGIYEFKDGSKYKGQY